MCCVIGVYSSYATPHFTSQTKSLLSRQVFDHVVCGKNILGCSCSWMLLVSCFGGKGCKNCHLRLLRWHRIMNDVTKITHKVLTSKQQRFLCSWSIWTGSEAHPASSTVGPGTKWPRYEVDHSPPSSAQGKNGCHDTSTSSVCLHGLETDDFFF